jgi:hypothetical protein
MLRTGVAANENSGSTTIFTSGSPSSLSLSTVDRFGNPFRGVVLFRVCESSNPSFNKLSFLFHFVCGDRTLTDTSAFSINEGGPLAIASTLRSSRSSRLAVESWFPSGSQGLSSTYYADCSWSVPLESLMSSMPLFRPIGSVVLNHQGLQSGSGTHPCSVQWSGLLRMPYTSENSSVSFELGSNLGSCLTLFIRDILCCGTCHHVGLSHNGRYGRRRSHAPCKCTVEHLGSSSAQFWPLSLYGNSDGEDPNWQLKWFSSIAHVVRQQQQQQQQPFLCPSSPHDIGLLPNSINSASPCISAAAPISLRYHLSLATPGHVSCAHARLTYKPSAALLR